MLTCDAMSDMPPHVRTCALPYAHTGTRATHGRDTRLNRATRCTYAQVPARTQVPALRVGRSQTRTLGHTRAIQGQPGHRDNRDIRGHPTHPGNRTKRRISGGMRTTWV